MQARHVLTLADFPFSIILDERVGELPRIGVDIRLPKKRWQEPRRLGTPPAQIAAKPACWSGYLAAKRNWSIEDTEVRLLEVSEKARQRVRHRDPSYVLETVLNAFCSHCPRSSANGQGLNRATTGR